MTLPVSLLLIYVIEWLLYYLLQPEQFWYAILCSKQLTISIALTYAYLLSESKSVKLKSLIVFLCCCSWVDTVLNVLWSLFDVKSNSLISPALLLFSWCLFLFTRRYDIESDEIDESKVMLLMLRPDGFFMYLKSLFGVPVSSICILADGFVYSFRTDSKKFTRTKYTDKWLLRHVCINTGVGITGAIKSSLERTIGLKRGVGIKCVYALRNTLKEMGAAWEPKTFLHNIPGLYAMQVLGGKNVEKCR